MSDDDLVAMARLAQRDDRMATGALYGDLADRIEALTEQLEAARADAKEAEAYAEELMSNLANTADTIWAEFKDKWDGERKYALRQIVKWLKGDKDD